MSEHLTHLNAQGQAHMVDVSDKPPQKRIACATGTLYCAPATLALLRDDRLPKGDVLAAARIAGIQGAKKCSELIPLCHPLPLHKVTLELEPQEDCIIISATTLTVHQTGVEMEALTAVSIAALTLYDMLKAVDKGMRIGDIRLLSKVKQ